jgi:hypothetical protein
MSLYLHQNMPGFFGDIGELADCLETFSHQDGLTSQLDYSYAMQQEIFDSEKLSCLIVAQALTDSNLHCKDAQGPGKKALFKMQQPYFFEHLRTYKANKQLL